MSHLDNFAGILLSLNEAALDDALWPAASGRIDEACGMRGNTLVMARGHDQADGEIFFARTCRYGARHEDWEQTYFNDYYPQDERVPRVTRLPDSRLVPVTDLYTEQERKTSATYNMSLPQGGYQKGLNVRLDGPEGASIYWALGDPSARGGWGSRQMEMIESLLPHMRHFLAVRHALGGARALGTSLSALLECTRIGLIHLDRLGRVIETNDRAGPVLRGGRGLFERGGFLHARVPGDDARLQELVADALPTYGLPAMGGSMMVLRPPSRSRQIVHVLPVGDSLNDFGIGRVAVLVVVVEPGDPPRLDAELVASALGLTKTESQVAVALAMGKTTSDIAKDKGQNISTARFHVKGIHAKLGLSRQTDLVRLVLSLDNASAFGRGQME